MGVTPPCAEPSPGRRLSRVLTGTRTKSAPGEGRNLPGRRPHDHVGRGGRALPARDPREHRAIRTNELDAGACRAGWYSRRVRASAERGRVQGPGRAEADLGPRTVTAALFPSAIPTGPPDRSTAISQTPRRSLDGSLQGSPDPSPDGSPNPSPDGSPRGWGTCGRRPRPVCAGQTLRGAGSRAKTARDPAPLRYVGVRPIDSAPVDGPPSSAHSGRNRGGRTIGPALRAGRAFARNLRKPDCGCAAIPTFRRTASGRFGWVIGQPLASRCPARPRGG